MSSRGFKGCRWWRNRKLFVIYGRESQRTRDEAFEKRGTTLGGGWFHGSLGMRVLECRLAHGQQAAIQGSFANLRIRLLSRRERK